MPKPLRFHKKSGVITPSDISVPADELVQELFNAFIKSGTHFHFPGDGRVYIDGKRLPDCLKERFYDGLEWHLRHFFVFHRGTKSNTKISH